ncbi:MAG TPA: hypothetical protein ENF38_01480 [Candidatus Aenigmarchaeota archaeon]|nr:hypothetical protein [Candidatus Aenigmarchaeota archaeon]
MPFGRPFSEEERKIEHLARFGTLEDFPKERRGQGRFWKGESLAYLHLKDIGYYALSKPIHRPPLPPKNFLIRMTKEHTEKVKPLIKDAKVSCIKTKTGARFCFIEFDNVKLDAIELCEPTYKYEYLIKHKELPSIEECREKGKNWFLVVKCEPKELCGL